MKRIDQICGLAVIDVDSGAKIGNVAKVILDAENKSIAGIDISPRGFMGGKSFIIFGDIEIFGDVSVLIKRNETDSVAEVHHSNADGRKRYKGSKRKDSRQKEHLEIGQKVYLTDGSDMGWFTNALVDEANGSIHALEVSKGYIDDLTKGRCWINEFSCGEQGITALSNGRG